MKRFLSNLEGILICLAIALPAWYLGRLFPIIGGPVFGILFGILLAFVRRPERFNKGIQYTSKKILQYSIILLGFEMNLFNIIKVGGQSLLIMLFTLSAAFMTAYFIGKALKLDKNPTILIGVGTAICGGSAIAATAPVIKAKDEEIAFAISTIFLFNIIAVFIFPSIGRLLGLSDVGFGMWAGTAINDTSSVVAAGVAWSNAAGNNTALVFATIVKLTRTLVIVPVTLILALYMARRAKKESQVSGENNFHFVKVFPWFVLGFILTSVINTFVSLPVWLPQAFVMIGKFMIVMAMAAIGLNTNLAKLMKNGTKPILLGMFCWLAIAVVSLIVQNFIGIV